MLGLIILCGCESDDKIAALQKRLDAIEPMIARLQPAEKCYTERELEDKLSALRLRYAGEIEEIRTKYVDIISRYESSDPAKFNARIAVCEYSVGAAHSELGRIRIGNSPFAFVESYCHCEKQ